MYRRDPPHYGLAVKKFSHGLGYGDAPFGLREMGEVERDGFGERMSGAGQLFKTLRGFGTLVIRKLHRLPAYGDCFRIAVFREGFRLDLRFKKPADA